MNITPKRKKILEAVQKCHGTISARDLAKKLDDIDQATVYRSLELFVEEGLVRRFVFAGTEALYEAVEHNHHHAVCTDCEKIVHIHVPDEKIAELIDVKDFDITSVELVVRGTCINS